MPKKRHFNQYKSIASSSPSTRTSRHPHPSIHTTNQQPRLTNHHSIPPARRQRDPLRPPPHSHP
ncbi:hypothetical protein IMZ48_14495 [Candidatus Bathyarchaeota archaeon]|nr:hypothetical protein [Candidatus Bathyarchaeota archaeon]